MHESDCFRLTNMTAPAVQDPRTPMRLHCRFDMGGEELYAVKWYKDDHEFFRYIPLGEKMVKYPVTGVHVDSAKSTCNTNSCDLLLKNVKRPQSSGAYRCEVSSEAPAFRLASETHNVTVAALPDEPPIIEGIKNTYKLGADLLATCTSGLGDPKPILTFYINKEPILKGFITEMNADAIYHHDQSNEINLRKSKIRIRIPLDGKYLNGPNEISCVSSFDDISSSAALSLSTSRTFSITDPNQIVNNQRWTDPGSSAVARSHSPAFVLCISAIFNYLRLQ